MFKFLQHLIPGVERPDPGVRNAKGE